MKLRNVAALLIALIAALGCGPAYAAINETEMTGGFVPVGLSGDDDATQVDSQGGGGQSSDSQTDSADDGHANDQEGGVDSGGNADAENPSESETEPSDGDDSRGGNGTDGNGSDGNGSGGNGSGGNGSDGNGSGGGTDGNGGGNGSGGKGTDGNDSDGNGSGGKGPDGNGSGGKAPKTSRNEDGAQGIELSDGSLVGVDDERHLVLVSAEGDTSMLDDTHVYTVETGDDGAVSVRNEAGAGFVSDGGTVRYTDAAGKTTTVKNASDAKSIGEKLKANSDNAEASAVDAARPGEKETELADEADQASVASQQAQSEGPESGLYAAPLAAAVAVVVVVAAGGGVIWKRKRR